MMELNYCFVVKCLDDEMNRQTVIIKSCSFYHAYNRLMIEGYTPDKWDVIDVGFELPQNPGR